MVMLLQAARSLMRLAASVRSGAARSAPMENNPVTGYLYANGGSQRSRITPDCAPQAYLEAFEHAARVQVFRAHDRLEELRARGRSAHEAWNEAGIELTKVSQRQ